MNLDEALTVYLYLMHQQRNATQERAFNAAWGIICRYAEETISREYQRS